MYALNSSSPHFDERPLVIITNIHTWGYIYIYIYIERERERADTNFISL